jgi:hypothetical protein
LDMPLHRRRALDPTREQLLALAEEVMQAAFQDVVPMGQGLIPVALPRPLWSEWLGHAALPQGVYARRHAIDWRHGELLFGAAWWSDVLGRKHWLLEATKERDLKSIGRLADPLGRGNGLIEDAQPLEYLAPLLSVGYRGQPPQLVVVCRCGYAGSPESLAWMGNMCGPCFDREQDGLPPAEGLPPARPKLKSFDSFALAPTQDVITCAESELLLRCWQPPWNGSAAWSRHWHQQGPWVVSPSVAHGGLLAVGLGPRVLLVSLRNGRTLAMRDVVNSGQVVGLAFAGHEGRRLVVSYQSSTQAVQGLLRAWEIKPEGQFGKPLFLTQLSRVSGIEAVSPKGQHLLLVTHPHRIEIRDTNTGKIVDRLKIPAGTRLRRARFLPDGSIVGSGSSEREDGPPPRLLRWSAEDKSWPILTDWLPRRPLERDPWVSVPLLAICHDLAVAPDGKSLACIEGDTLVRRDTVSFAELSRFRPARTSLRGGLAFSADGQLLVQTEHGLAVWPWRELLG